MWLKNAHLVLLKPFTARPSGNGKSLTTSQHLVAKLDRVFLPEVEAAGSSPPASFTPNT